MEWIGGLVMGVLVGFILLREPYMRSARVVALVAAFALAACAIFSVVPSWSVDDSPGLVMTIAWTLVGVGVSLLPLLIAARFEPALSALPPADHAEHDRIGRVHASMAAGPTPEQVATILRSLRESSPPDAWLPAHAALIDQIELANRARQDAVPLDAESAIKARRRTTDAWRAAIDATRRFWR